MLYTPGEKVPHSGIYTVTHGLGHAREHEVTCIKGRKFPPCRNCKGTRFELEKRLSRLRWKQAPGYSACGFGKALQRDSEDLAGWKELHARDKRSGITGDEGRHSKIVWACSE